MKDKVRRFSVRFVKAYLAITIVWLGLAAIYVGWHRDRIFPAPDIVIIYGRDTCSITTEMRSFLTQAKVPFQYVNVDDGWLQDQEMQLLVQKIPHQELSPGDIHFPIVRIAGQLFETPDHERVLSLYKSASVK